MAQSFLIFDFGTDEEAAQQARHRIEGWKQAFRLGSKILLKFERQETESEDEKGEPGEAATKSGKAVKNKAKSEKAGPEANKSGEPQADGDQHIRLLVRLDFSDHEKLSHHRWLERIPSEEPFKSAEGRVIRHGENAFDETAELFDSLK